MNIFSNYFKPEPQPFYVEAYNHVANSQIVSAVTGKVSELAGQISGKVKGTLSEFVKEGTILGNSYLKTADFMKNNAMNLSYAGAAIGGLTVVNSSINLLQKKADDNLLLPKKETTATQEALKILTGSVLIGASIAFGAGDALERSKVLNLALGAGLVNAAWRASIVVKPTFLVFQLKSVESDTPVKNVAVFPE